MSKSASGLSSEEARRRFAEQGPNETVEAPRAGPVLQLLRLCLNPLAIILLLASLVSAALGEVVNASLVAAMVLVSVALNFVQAYRSDNAARLLRDRVAPTATAMRDGEWREVDRRELVPGDLVRLCAGDLVPADATLLESRDLHVQQAALTGESLPVEKTVSASPTTAGPADAAGRVFLGTSVVSGVAVARVDATGRKTAFGEIAGRLSSRPPETDFDRGTRHFGLLIMKAVLFLVLFIVLASIATHRDPLQSLLFAVALAVGLTPEFLPMITTVTLGRGALRMAREKVVVKNLSAIQNLGSIDVLLCDKTGTLTEGTMALDQSLDAGGRPDERPLMLAALNSRFDTGIKSPLDAAILARSGEPAAGWEKLDEIPFDFERRRLSVVVARGDERILVSKGAPGAILAICASREVDGAVGPISTTERERFESVYRAASAKGLRVLGVAWRAVEAQPAYVAADERDLTFVGFVTFQDPVREGVVDAIAALGRDGVEVKVLTGDNELVARHVCGQVGLDASRIVLGEEIDRLGDGALGHVAEEVDVFARVSPGQKNRILQALRARKHVVGFLGDGINDAPSLHAADVGISVAGAVDVARDAAEIVLLERSLSVLHTGILEGRRAFGNVLKYLLMGTSSNFGNMFSMAAAAFFLPFLPMLPTQILLNNFLYDLSQVAIPSDSVDPAYIEKPHRWDVGLIRNFMLGIGPVSSIFDFLTFFVLLRVFHASEALFHTGWFVESLATQTLVIFVIRTRGAPWSHPPGRLLLATVLGVVATGALLPFTPAASYLGFVRPPAAFFAFLGAATIAYLVLVELVKRLIVRRMFEPR